jgi:hypothetical protein
MRTGAAGLPPDVGAAWAARIERRYAEIESGAVSLLECAEALGRLDAEFRRISRRGRFLSGMSGSGT